MLQDHHQRLLATDPSRSFIVEAPAGSGKTEILTQRFLRLLAQVQAPEQIIALTFTRKAANEMRERVLSALRHAALGHLPSSPHQAMTLDYAQQALMQDQQLGWHLLKNGNRLRIMTIDALCQMLVHAIPLQSTHYATISEQPQLLYYQAVRNYIHLASATPEYQNDLKILLQHLDNRQDLLVGLFAQILAKRDQWLSPLFLARNQSKQDVEQALAWIEQHELTRFCTLLPKDLQHDIVTLIQLFITHTTIDNPKLRALEDWHQFAPLNAQQATALASIFLTSTQTLRKSFDHHIGFKRESCSGPIYNEIKNTSKIICETLNGIPEFVEGLIQINRLPKPEFDPQQWKVLQALFQILPLLVAHLELQFQEHNAIDFTGIAHQAKLALGHENTPSDLALYLDHKIQHFLIDEFQDTSLQQFELITQFLQGWEVHDGRTLFVVGDPMQSIYRFRAAEVGLFLRAKTQGIGPVSLHPLQLCANFRSSSPIVDWVNQQFATIFPAHDDIETGAVSFHAATAMVDTPENSFIQAYQFVDSNQEAEGVLDIVQSELRTHPTSTIAILVRSRSQLQTIVRLLRRHQISFQGVDIDLLAQLPHLRDIWSFTQAFLMPANRLAWLAFLRSPWGGFTLADLLAISRFAKSIYLALANSQDIPQLSEDGRVRAQYIYQIFQAAYLQRHQYTLVDTLAKILEQLHINSILNPFEQEDLEQYWTLLRQFTKEEQIVDYALFQEKFTRLYSQKSNPARLQIMTIHKSKGLEFDCVVLPGLGSVSQSNERGLIRWLKLPRETTEDLFLISPIKAAKDEECRVYQYLEHLDAQKMYYESQRLLYVAVTRAKHRLYLLDCHAAIRKKSFRHMLESQLFLERETEQPAIMLDNPTQAELQRLPLHYYQSPPLIIKPSGYATQNTLLTTPVLPRLIGIVTHSILQWICTYHPENYDDIPWALATRHLQKMGVVDSELHHALLQIKHQIHAFFHDERGQWIAKHRSDEHNEYALLSESHSAVRIIDRCFSDKHTFWIIDFKTGSSDSEIQAQHQAQVEQYAALFHHLRGLPIRCGLYYLSNLQWIEWEPISWKTSCT
jgi:ATP-dependent helicase/nuclease subunit A